MPSILGANEIKATGYDVDNSIRFNGSNSVMQRNAAGTPSSTKIWSISAWVKRCSLGSNQVYWMHQNASSHSAKFQLGFHSSTDTFRIETYDGSSEYNLSTDMKFKDTNAWYSILVNVDSTQGTEADRYKIFVNGIQAAVTETGSGYPAEDWTLDLGSQKIALGRYQAASPSMYYDGYLAEVVYADGQTLAPTDIGEFDEDSGIFKPIDVSELTLGNAGFYINFADSSDLGAATGNDFALTNLDATDQSTDTCTNNFMTLNRLSTDTGVTLTEGNVESDYDGSVGNAKGSIGLTRGRWYWEIKLTNAVSGYPMVGIGSMNQTAMQKPTGGSYPGGFTDSYGVYGSNLRLYANGTNEGNKGDDYGSGDIIGIYLDLESSTKTIKWYKDGSSILSDDIVNTGDDYPYTCIDYNGAEGAVNVQYNFGGTPGFAISSGNTDDNGYGNFEFSPNISSTKYYAVCTKNIAEFG